MAATILKPTTAAAAGIRLAADDRNVTVSAELDRLLARVADGDADAFASFYDQTKARVFGLVLRVLRDQGYSEETVQEVYLQVWRSASAFHPEAGSALSWVLTLAHRRAVDRVRAEHSAARRDLQYGSAMSSPAFDEVVDTALRRDEQRQVVRCLSVLSEAQRRCLELAYYDGLTYQQVAEGLATSLSTVKSRMRDGLARLRGCLRANADEAGEPA
ncbi:RNA polymerase, sigma-24 subunit, ECF subfamily [Segniliparus rotundus DSM 44985]|uniref:RNA polymerase, sigma-24 subunit, ECF subfamily n=1 Tax=Segniliparus rotundus (strain ATCC BAA-972 / CDC 1076 / CIP 108378 / DSM 44985 / JCM 13578) TaxID=640132 RepID=D6Z9I7_SEGRD|nr:ECF RNA polymerase sigma factor SigK [Segniliparus rotundus]ADG96514.1 RNA polymerase, sigma-24 subunit, ECF subfamily [Segniliparus rotundus DSM 44985]